MRREPAMVRDNREIDNGLCIFGLSTIPVLCELGLARVIREIDDSRCITGLSTIMVLCNM